MRKMQTPDSEDFQNRWRPWRSLLDDDTPVVRDALVHQLKLLPEEGRVFLQQMSEEDDPIPARHALELIKSLGWVDGIRDFTTFIQSQRYELETGWFLLDRTVYPAFELSSATFFLDKLSTRCRELLTPPMPRLCARYRS